MTTTKETVEQFLSAAREHGFTVTLKGENVVCVSKSFTAGDRDAFIACDMFGGCVLRMAPLRGGSMWGTDGGSVGGAVALTTGHYSLNKSGTAKRFMKALALRLAVSQ